MTDPSRNSSPLSSWQMAAAGQCGQPNYSKTEVIVKQLFPRNDLLVVLPMLTEHWSGEGVMPPLRNFRLTVCCSNAKRYVFIEKRTPWRTWSHFQGSKLLPISLWQPLTSLRRVENVHRRNQTPACTYIDKHRRASQGAGDKPRIPQVALSFST